MNSNIEPDGIWLLTHRIKSNERTCFRNVYKIQKNKHAWRHLYRLYDIIPSFFFQLVLNGKNSIETFVILHLFRCLFLYIKFERKKSNLKRNCEMNKHYFALATLSYYDINELKNKYLKIKLIISIFPLLFRWNWIENCHRRLQFKCVFYGKWCKIRMQTSDGFFYYSAIITISNNLKKNLLSKKSIQYKENNRRVFVVVSDNEVFTPTYSNFPTK